MKKSLLALAVLSAFAGAASAQTSVTIYGIADAGLVRETGGAAGSVTKLTSGVQSGSRLGFRGTEDLGGGLSANFVFESSVKLDTGGFNQGNTPFGRQTWVGLNGGWGSLQAGRQYGALFITLDNVDPFGSGLAGQATNLFSQGAEGAGIAPRINNSIKYATPNTLGGFFGDIEYGFGEVPGDTKKARAVAGAIGYVNGPFDIRLAHDNVKDAAGINSTKTTLLTGKYNFEVVKLDLAYAVNRNNVLLRSDDWLVGVDIPFGASNLLLSYIRKNDKLAANRDANQYAIGYTYALSKRTNFYTSYARISNKNGALYTVGNASEAGSGDKAFNIGVRHKF